MTLQPESNNLAQSDSKPELHTREESRQTLLYLVARTGRLVRSMQDELLTPFGLGATDYAVLAQIHFEGPQSTAELSRQLRLTAQAVGQSVGKLEQREMLSREQSVDDRRVMILQLTPVAEALVAKCTQALQSVEASLSTDMTPREVQMLKILLEAALGNLSTALQLHD